MIWCLLEGVGRISWAGESNSIRILTFNNAEISVNPSGYRRRKTFINLAQKCNFSSVNAEKENHEKISLKFILNSEMNDLPGFTMSLQLCKNAKENLSQIVCSSKTKWAEWRHMGKMKEAIKWVEKFTSQATKNMMMVWRTKVKKTGNDGNLENWNSLFFYSRADPSEIWDDDDAMLLCNRFIVREGMWDKRRIFLSRQSSWNLAGLYLDNRNLEKFREISRINTPENLNEMLLLCI